MSNSDYQQLDELVRESAPELRPALAKLLAAVRRLSEITVEEVLKLELADNEMTLEHLRRVLDRRVVLPDLAAFCRRCLESQGFTAAQRRRIQQTLRLVLKLEDLETRQRIESFLGI